MKNPANILDTCFGFMVHDRSLEDCFDYALEKNIGHLELDLKKPHLQLKTFTKERIAAVLFRSRQTGVSLSLHPPYNKNLCSKVPFVRMACVGYLKKIILLAHQLETTHVTLHLGSFYRFATWANPRHNALERLYKVLDKLFPVCEKYGVTLALENMIPIPPDAGYCFLGDNVEDFLHIFARYDTPYIRFCLDIGHANTAEGPLPYVEALREKIVNIHFHDNMGKYDDHLSVGEGTVPWPELMHSLNGMRGPFVSECFSVRPHQAIKALKSYF